jgi:hypothetical protein
MTGPEDFPATDVRNWQQSTVDKAFAELMIADDDDANVDEPITRWQLLLILGISAALWAGIIAAVVAIWTTWLVAR